MMRKPLLVVWFALSLAAAPPRAGAAETPQPPDDPALRERILALVADLGASDYALREEATRQLLAIGDPAVWALREAVQGDDYERRTRAAQILEEISWVPPSEHRAIAAAVAEMKETRDPRTVARLARELRGKGKAGAAALRDLFASTKEVSPDDVELSITLPTRTFASGSKISCRVTLTYRGRDGIWIRPDDFSLIRGTSGVETFNIRRPQKPLMVAGGTRSGDADALLYLAPGQSYETDVTLHEVVPPGPFSLTARYGQANTAARRGAPPPSGVGPTPVSVVSRDVSVCGVPPAGESSGRDYAILEVVADRTEWEAGEEAVLRWTFRAGPALDQVRGDVQGSIWITLLDERGEAVLMEQVADLSAAPGPAEDRVRKGQAPRFERTGDARLRAPAAGRYTLLLWAYVTRGVPRSVPLCAPALSVTVR